MPLAILSEYKLNLYNAAFHDRELMLKFAEKFFIGIAKPIEGLGGCICILILYNSSSQ